MVLAIPLHTSSYIHTYIHTHKPRCVLGEARRPRDAAGFSAVLERAPPGAAPPPGTPPPHFKGLRRRGLGMYPPAPWCCAVSRFLLCCAVSSCVLCPLWCRGVLGRCAWPACLHRAVWCCVALRFLCRVLFPLVLCGARVRPPPSDGGRSRPFLSLPYPMHMNHGMPWPRVAFGVPRTLGGVPRTP